MKPDAPQLGSPLPSKVDAVMKNPGRIFCNTIVNRCRLLGHMHVCWAKVSQCPQCIIAHAGGTGPAEASKLEGLGTGYQDGAQGAFEHEADM